VIGEPIPAMVARVKAWLRKGRKVKIFTARVADSHSAEDVAAARMAIEAWCREHLGEVLDITATKDSGMVELWDDRAVKVETNTGELLSKGAPPAEGTVC